MIPEIKICGECGVEKSKECFSIRRKPNGYTWLRRECKECENNRKKLKYATNEEYRRRVIDKNIAYEQLNREKRCEYYKEHRRKNKDTIIEKARKRYIKNATRVKEKRKEYYYNNKEKVIAGVNSYVERNKPKVRAAQRLNHKKKRATDLGYKMLKVLRGRLTAAIKKKGRKCYRTKELVGCDMPKLFNHIQSQFKEGMGWENHGLRGWHVDHIIPCDAFDLTKPEDQKICFHYTNLQPLWWYDNLKKSNKVA